MPPGLSVVLLFDAFEQADPAIQIWLNEQLVSGLCRLRHVYTVLAGRELPEATVTWQGECHSHVLPAVAPEAHKQFCADVGIRVPDDTVLAFHRVFDGKPGLFAEYALKLAQEGIQHEP